MEDLKGMYPETVKGPVDEWTDDRLSQLAAGYKELAQDEVKWNARLEAIAAHGDAWEENLTIPPYIAIALRDGDLKTLKTFAGRRGGNPELTAKVKALLK